MIKALIAHPLTRGLDLDDPATTGLRRRIIEDKQLLREIYTEWYGMIARAIPEGPGHVLELGSGPGFLADFVSGLISSDTFRCPGIRIVADGLHLPLAPGTLRGIAMTNVLHHLPDVRRFFSEAAASVRPDGVIVMVEPWVTPWSRLIYTRLHHEPFEPDASDWEFPSTGPLSGANGALPWILFERDRQQFEREFPQWSIESIAPLMPFRYLVSGGISLRSLMPAWSSAPWRALEGAMGGWSARMAMFACIRLRRVENDADGNGDGGSRRGVMSASAQQTRSE
jgi:SAM-dependent methyltransferase